MDLEQAAQLLKDDGDHCRFFVDTYKLYRFTGEHTLKEYLEFVDHETVEWMRGFPAHLNVKVKFVKPKTALLKLLKKPEVAAALGDAFVKQVHQKVWDTFKQQGDIILAERSKYRLSQNVAHGDAESIDAESVGSEIIEEVPTFPLQQTHIQQQQPQQQPQNNYNNYNNHNNHNNHHHHLEVPTTNDQERIAVLKAALTKMADLLPAGASDAFRQLVAFV